MKTLKMKSLKSALAGILLLWVLAGAIGYTTIPALLNVVNGPIPWEEVDFSGDIEGTYITGTVYGIYDYYCEEVEKSKVVAREYLVDADDYYYIGMRARKDDMDAANALMDASYDYLQGYDDGSAMMLAQYEITGVITAIPSDSLTYYHEYLEFSEMDEETKEMFLPYYIDVNQVGANGVDSTEAVVMTILGLGFFILGTVFLIWAVTGHYQKFVKEYIAGSPNPDMAGEKVERFLENTPEVHQMRYNGEFVCGQNGSTTMFGETEKIAWIYLNITERKRYFITVSKQYQLFFGFADGSRQSVSVKNEDIAKEHMQKLAELCPRAILGYSSDLDKMFNKDLTGFLNLQYNNVQVADSFKM